MQEIFVALFLSFPLYFLTDQVERPPLDLQISLGQILSQYPQAEELDPAHQGDDAHQGGPAGDRIPKDQLSHDGKQDQHKGQDAEQYPIREANIRGRVEKAVMPSRE